jgi:MFS family permease
MMRDLGAGGPLLGLLGAAYFYPYAVMQLPAGLLSDSWGPRKSITLFFGVASAGSLILGLAGGPAQAILGRTLVGLGVSVFFVPAMKVLAEWFGPRRFAFAAGLFLAFGGLGMLSATAPLALLSVRIGWRAAFVAVAGITLLLVALVWFCVRDRPSDLGWPSPSRPEESATVSIGLLQGVRQVLSHPPFWAVAAWFFFNFGVFFSFGSLWGGPYLMHIHHLDSTQAGQVLSMLALGMIAGSPFMSFFSDRVFRARKPVMVLGSLGMIGLTALLAFRTDELSLVELHLLCLGFGLLGNSVAVVGFTMTKELFPVEISGTATGLVNLFPFAGTAVFQPLLGAILERHGRTEGAFTLAGYEQAFLVLFLSALAAMVSTLFLRETLPGEDTERGPDRLAP